MRVLVLVIVGFFALFGLVTGATILEIGFFLIPVLVTLIFAPKLAKKES